MNLLIFLNYILCYNAALNKEWKSRERDDGVPVEAEECSSVPDEAESRRRRKMEEATEHGKNFIKRNIEVYYI